MAEAILMPRLSDTMTEGVIAAWHKNVGDVVKKGDLLAEIETDKATMELESYQEGVLLHRGGNDGAKLQVAFFHYIAYVFVPCSYYAFCHGIAQPGH